MTRGVVRGLISMLLAGAVSAGAGVTTASADTAEAGPRFTVRATDPDDGWAAASGVAREEAPAPSSVGRRAAVSDAATGAPEAPEDLDATVTSATSVSLSWSAVTGSAGSPVTGYRLTRLGSGEVVALGAESTSYSWTGLSPGTTYRFTLVALNDQGPSDPAYAWSGATVTVPPHVWGLSAAWDSGWHFDDDADDPAKLPINASWSPPVFEDGRTVSAYEILVDGDVIGSLPADTRDAEITGATTGYYTIGVAATDSTGTTGPVAEVRVAVNSAPVNDDFADRLVIDPAFPVMAASNWRATGRPDDPQPPAAYANGGDASVWYSWTAPSTGRLQVRTWEAGNPWRDTTLAAYSGTSLDDLVELAGNDNVDCCHYRSKILVDVEAGETYTFVVDGYPMDLAGGTGLFYLAGALYPPVASTATAIEGTRAGRSVTLTATVTGDVVAPVGWMTFHDGEAYVDTVEVDADTTTVSHTIDRVTGGHHDYTASFSPADDQVHDPSLSTSWRTWLPASTTSTSIVRAVTVVDEVELDLVVTSPDGIPTGAVQVYDGPTTGTPVGQATLEEDGRATAAFDGVVGGPHEFTAVFVPADDQEFEGSRSESTDVTVNQTWTSTSLEVAVVGRTVTLQAQTQASTSTPTGTIELRDGVDVVGTLPASTHPGSLVLPSVAAGSHFYSASFVPSDPRVFTESESDTVTAEVSPTPTTTDLAVTTAGSTVTWSTTVDAGSEIADGRVEVRDGTVVVARLDLTDGRAARTVRDVSPGSHSYRATFVPASGDQLTSSSARATVRVAGPPTPVQVTSRTTLRVTPRPHAGARPKLTVSVARRGAPARGVVVVRIGSRRWELELHAGVASYRLPTLRPGILKITASYGGDATTSSSRASLRIKVRKKP